LADERLKGVYVVVPGSEAMTVATAAEGWGPLQGETLGFQVALATANEPALDLRGDHISVDFGALVEHGMIEKPPQSGPHAMFDNGSKGAPRLLPTIRPAVAVLRQQNAEANEPFDGALVIVSCETGLADEVG
jgi:hypothetical protein